VIFKSHFLSLAVSKALAGTTPLTLIASNSDGASNFNVSGFETTYSVTFPTSVPLSFGNASMSITSITTCFVGSKGRVPSSGTQTFQVGGTLNVAANQLSGVYSGSIPITITYE
jgi:hypothetical protein